MRAAAIITALVCINVGGCTTTDGTVRGRTANFYAEASVPGESMDDFVARIAPKALTTSKEARATVCGEVQNTAAGFSVQLRTDGYVDSCNVPQSTRPYLLINGTAVDASEDHFSQINWQRPGYLITPWSVKYQDGVAKRPRTIR